MAFGELYVSDYCFVGAMFCRLYIERSGICNSELSYFFRGLLGHLHVYLKGAVGGMGKMLACVLS